MSKPLTSRLTYSKGPFPALIPVGRHAGRPAISLRRPITLVGSRENAHVHLASQSVDPAHALIVVSNGRAYVRDLASHSGVQVNDEPVLEAELGRDDVLKIGSFQFRVSVPGAAGTRKEVLPTARFMVDGQSVTMDGHVLLIGRRGACNVTLTDPMASRVHAAVIAVNGQYVVRDLGSRAGTLVNAEKVHEQVLESGDEIHVGSHGVYVQIAATAAGESGTDLVDLEDSLAAVPQDAEPAVEASIDEPDPLDLHLPLAGIEEEEVAEGEVGPDLSAEAPVDEDEDAPIAMDLELDLDVPEPVAAAERVAEEEPVAPAEPAEAVEVEVTAPAEVAEPVEVASAEPEPVVEEKVEEVAPPVELTASEPAVEAAVAETSDLVESPARGPEQLELAAPAPMEATEDASTPEVADEHADIEIEVAAPIDTVEEPAREVAEEPAAAEVAEPIAISDEPAAEPIEERVEEVEEPPQASANEEPIAIAEEQIASEPVEEVASVVATQEEASPVADEKEPVAEVAPEEQVAPVAAADATDDLLKLVAEEVGEHAPADSLSGTPFGTALGEVVDAGIDEGPATEAAEPSDEAAIGFEVGPNQVLYVTGSPVGWHDAASLAPSTGGSQFEVSLSGVYGTVEGVERLPDPPDVTEASPELAAAAAEPAHQEPQASIPVATEEGVAAEVAVEPPPVPEARKEQLLGFIRIEEMAPGAPIKQRGPIEPVRSVVEPGEPASEPAVELPLETDAPARPGQRAAAPAPADSPDSLHAVKPPPAAYRITRGLSSLTGGGRAVDVFSQLPVVSEDPVLGKVSGPAQIPPIEDPALEREPVSPPTHDDLTNALQPQAEFDAPDAEAGRPGAAPPLFIRKLKRLFRERGGTMSVVAAMAAAGAVAYGLTPSATIVRAEINYHNFTRLPVTQQRATEIRQHELLTDPAVLANAVETVSVGPDAPGPGFLASPVVLSTQLDRADVNLWPSDRPGTLALSLRSSDPEADAARLRALINAVLDAPANKRLVAASRESAEKASRARAELATLDRNIRRLEQEQETAQARLASADEGAAPVTMPEPSAEERAWREASLATLKAQSDVAELRDKKVDPADPRMRASVSRLATARADEAVARDRFVTTQQAAGSENTVERHAAETAISLRTLRAQRVDKEAEVKQLESNAAAATYPELPSNGGVWTNRTPDHRKLYAIGAAAVVGLSLSTYLGGKSRRFG